MPLARLINCVYDNRTGELVREEDLGLVEVDEDPYEVLARMWLPKLEQFLKDREGATIGAQRPQMPLVCDATLPVPD